MVMPLFVKIEFRWWVRPSIKIIKFIAMKFRVSPNIESITKFITDYGIKVKLCH